MEMKVYHYLNHTSLYPKLSVLEPAQQEDLLNVQGTEISAQIPLVKLAVWERRLNYNMANIKCLMDDTLYARDFQIY